MILRWELWESSSNAAFLLVHPALVCTGSQRASLPCSECGLTSVRGISCIWNSQGHISISHTHSNRKHYDFCIIHLESLATWVSFCPLIHCCSFLCPKLYPISTGHFWCPCNWNASIVFSDLFNIHFPHFKITRHDCKHMSRFLSAQTKRKTKRHWVGNHELPLKAWPWYDHTELQLTADQERHFACYSTTTPYIYTSFLGWPCAVEPGAILPHEERNMQLLSHYIRVQNQCEGVVLYYSITNSMQRGPEKTVPVHLHSFTTSAQNQEVFSYSLLVSCNISSLLNIFCPRIMFFHFVVQTTWSNAKDILEKFWWFFPRVFIEARCLYTDRQTACLMIISDYIAWFAIFLCRLPDCF